MNLLCHLRPNRTGYLLAIIKHRLRTGKRQTETGHPNEVLADGQLLPAVTIAHGRHCRRKESARLKIGLGHTQFDSRRSRLYLVCGFTNARHNAHQGGHKFPSAD
jgi:hypothetical protein